MALITKPDLRGAWASSGSKAAPTPIKMASGWGYEMMPFELENWLQNKTDVTLQHLNQRGVAEWDNYTEYQANRSYCTGSDGVVYRALTTNTGNDPTADSGTNWMRAFLSEEPNGNITLAGGVVPSGQTRTVKILSNPLSAGTVNFRVGDTNLGNTTNIDLDGNFKVFGYGTVRQVETAYAPAGLKIKSTQTGGFWAKVTFADGTTDIAAVGMANDGSGRFVLQTLTAQPVVLGYNSAEVARVNSNGIAIGTASGSNVLTVWRGAGTASYAEFVGNGDTANGLLIGQDNTGLARISQLGNKALTLWTNGVERARWQGDGSFANYAMVTTLGRSTGAASDFDLTFNHTNFNTFFSFSASGTQYAGLQAGQGYGLIWNVNSGLAHRWRIGGSDRLLLDSQGNLGLRATPSAWATGVAAVELPAGTALLSGSSATTLVQNAFLDSAGWKYKGSGYAGAYSQSGGTHQWLGAVAGTGGSTIPWTTLASLDSTGFYSFAGPIGYGVGAGGVANQVTQNSGSNAKTNPVTLNRPSGQVVTGDSAIPGAGSVTFVLNNATVGVNDVVQVCTTGIDPYYSVRASIFSPGVVRITVQNETPTSRSESIAINFVTIKGATS